MNARKILCGPDPESDPRNTEKLEKEGYFNPLFMTIIEIEEDKEAYDDLSMAERE